MIPGEMSSRMARSRSTPAARREAERHQHRRPTDPSARTIISSGNQPGAPNLTARKRAGCARHRRRHRRALSPQTRDVMLVALAARMITAFADAVKAQGQTSWHPRSVSKSDCAPGRRRAGAYGGGDRGAVRPSWTDRARGTTISPSGLRGLDRRDQRAQCRRCAEPPDGLLARRVWDDCSSKRRFGALDLEPFARPSISPPATCRCSAARLLHTAGRLNAALTSLTIRRRSATLQNTLH
jgi:hypothetical protein